MVLLRVQLEEFLHPDVGKAEWVGPVLLVKGGVYLQREDRQLKWTAGQKPHWHILND